MTIKEIDVPFDPAGNQLHQATNYHYVNGTYVKQDPEWRTQTGPFDDGMEFVSVCWSSSGVTRWKNKDGRYFWMSKTEFERIIPFMIKGYLVGRFYFHKQGSYYSLRYLDA